MAGESGTATPGLDGEPAAGREAGPADLPAALEAEPWRFDFFQAVRRLEAARAAGPRIGCSARPADDPVRFGQPPSLSFAPSTVAQFIRGDGGRAPRLLAYFFGLLGPNGALPMHLTDYAHERATSRRDPTLVRFLDIFHHRMISLFYRAWAHARPTASRDRPRSDWFARYLGSLAGYGTPALLGRDAMPDPARLFWAGALACQARHPYGLRGLLAGFFRLPVGVREFVGEWVVLPPQDRCRLGAAASSATLGHSALLGACVWSVQHRFRVILGPLAFADFIRFLPGSPSLARLAAMVRSYTGDELAWDLNLVLQRDEVPALTLGGGGRLGWTTWLPGAGAGRDPDDLVIVPRLGD